MMKKLLLITAIITATTAYSATPDYITKSLKNLENEINILNQKEANKFKEEEKKNALSVQRYSNYVKMINQINSRIEYLNANMSTSFFSREQKSVLDRFQKLDKQLRDAAEMERKKIDEFKQLKAILGY